MSGQCCRCDHFATHHTNARQVTCTYVVPGLDFPHQSLLDGRLSGCSLPLGTGAYAEAAIASFQYPAYSIGHMWLLQRRTGDTRQ